MTWKDLLFWIILAIFAYFLIKISLVLFIIAVILLVVYFLVNLITNGSSNNSYKYAPENFYTRSFYQNPNQLFDQSINRQIDRPISSQSNNQINQLTYPILNSYENIANYYKETPLLQNFYNNSYNNLYPQSISEYCVDKKIKETGDISLAIASCGVPSSISGAFIQR